MCAPRSGLETKLKHCLMGSDIFADQTPGVDARQQFSASPSGKIRDVSEAKKKALQARRHLTKPYILKPVTPVHRLCCHTGPEAGRGALR